MNILKKYIVLTILLINVNFLLAQQNVKTTESQRITYISGKIDAKLKYDTLSLVLHGPFYDDGEPPEQGATEVLHTIADQNGSFKFRILTENSPFHISLYLSSKRSLRSGGLLGYGEINDFLILAGDSIHVVFDKDKQYYTGKGSDLFDAQKSIENIDKGNIILTHDDHDCFRKDMVKWLNQKDSLLNVQLGLLATYHSKLSPISYRIIRADIIGANREWVYRRISFAGPFFVAGTPIKKDLSNLCTELEQRPAYFDQEDRATLSPKYIHYLYDKLRTEVKYERIINNVNVFLNDNYFPAINKQYTGILRDKLLVYWLTQVSALNSLLPEYLEEALSVIQTPAFIKIGEDLKATFAKGETILDFDFKDPNGKTVHLADLKGKVLLIDLWFSGCGGCIAVAGGLPKVEEAVNNPKDVAFVSISIDKDKRIWLKSIDKNPSGKHYTHYTTSTTTYLYTAGTAANNPFIKKYVPSGSYPSLLIIDKEGKIFSSTPSWPISDKGKKDLIKEIKLAIGNY